MSFPENWFAADKGLVLLSPCPSGTNGEGREISDPNQIKINGSDVI